MTQYHRNTLKLRTVERFSRTIWLIIFVCILIGTLRFFEHDAAVYNFCMGKYLNIYKYFKYLFRHRARPILGKQMYDKRRIFDYVFKSPLLESFFAVSRFIRTAYFACYYAYFFAYRFLSRAGNRNTRLKHTVNFFNIFLCK